MRRQKPFYDEEQDKSFETIYKAGTKRYSLVNQETGVIEQELIHTLRPMDTKKKKRNEIKPGEYFTKLHVRVTDAINSREIEGYEIIVLMNLISRITYQNNWAVDKNGVKMSLRSIAESAGLDKNKMNIALESLQEKGFIVITPIDKKSNGVVVGKLIAYKG